jgi:subtilisin family serine protease
MNNIAASPPPQPTGNMLVMFQPNRKPKEIERLISNAIGAKVVHSRDFRAAGPDVAEAFAEAGALSLDRLGIVVIKAPEGDGISVAATTLRARKEVVEVRPEFWMHVLAGWDERYAAWVRDGLSLLADPALRALLPPGGIAAPSFIPVAEQVSATWGLTAMGVDRSTFSGAGIKIAVLDTGLDLVHPDFAGRSIVSASFVPGEDVQDVQGHGTHVIGTACGPLAPAEQVRYGVAYEAEIHVGKVLNNAGSGTERWILAGIEWAVESKCEIISLSLGRAVQPGEPPDPFYERAGEYALENGSLIIAAAGNESWRQYNSIRPVTSPANAASIMAVAAVDAKMKVANFSCGGINPAGGEVNIAGPGVDVLSSVPVPRNYDRFSGTSMATPHVAGIAALLAQSDKSLRGKALWTALERGARNIGHPARDVGWGLVMAPGTAVSMDLQAAQPI